MIVLFKGQCCLQSYTQQGLRMIGLAYKPLSCSWLKAQKLERQAVECQLIFLGLVALENKLKPQSASKSAVQLRNFSYDKGIEV